MRVILGVNADPHPVVLFTCRYIPAMLPPPKNRGQCCGAENIFFETGSVEPEIRIAVSAPARDSFVRYLENGFFDLSIDTFLCEMMHVLPLYD